jgi:diguanylate cyclase (GGDEF)-like protein
LACNAIVFGFLVAIGLLELIPNEIAWYLSFAMLCANAIGAVGAYALEHASRTAFLERLSLEEMAARDGLTRLLNRQAFEFRARNAWRNATTMQRAVAVVMVDVDYFKRFNDQYGHQAGDDCLRRVAACVRDAIAPERDELVARYGGEELIALLVGRTPVDVEAVAQRIVDSVAELRIPHQASVVCEHVSVSVGACQPTSDATIPFATLAHTADQALYLAKHQGRNRSVSIDASGAFDRQSSADEGVTRPEARALLRSENEEIGRAAAPA